MTTTITVENGWKPVPVTPRDSFGRHPSTLPEQSAAHPDVADVINGVSKAGGMRRADGRILLAVTGHDAFTGILYEPDGRTLARITLPDDAYLNDRRRTMGRIRIVDDLDRLDGPEDVKPLETALRHRTKRRDHERTPEVRAAKKTRYDNSARAKELNLLSRRRYYAEHRDEINERRRLLRHEARRDGINAGGRRRHQEAMADPERFETMRARRNASNRRYYANHRESILAKRRERYAERVEGR